MASRARTWLTLDEVLSGVFDNDFGLSDSESRKKKMSILSLKPHKIVATYLFYKIMGNDFHQIRKQLKRSLFTHYSKQGVNSSCCAQFVQLQHHFSKTRDPMIKMRPVPA